MNGRQEDYLTPGRRKNLSGGYYRRRGILKRRGGRRPKQARGEKTGRTPEEKGSVSTWREGGRRSLDLTSEGLKQWRE